MGTPSSNLPATIQSSELKVQLDSVRGMLERQSSQFAIALPRHIKAEQFIRVAMTTIAKNPDLLKCTATSVLACLMEAAELGLQVNGKLGEAYLIPFNNKVKDGKGGTIWRKECQFIPGYKGLMKLARNSGEISTIRAAVVYRGDFLKVRDGIDPVLEHVKSEEPPKLEKNERLEDAVRGSYAICKMKDGSIQFVFLWKWEIERARAVSKAADNGPWITHYPEMCEKTAIRRLGKYMPQSPEIQRALNAEDLADAGLSQGLEPIGDLSQITDGSSPAELGKGEILPPKGLDGIVDEERRNAPTQQDSAHSPKTSERRGSGSKSADAPPPAAAHPGENPNYMEGFDPDPGIGRSLFQGNREPGQEG